MGNHRKCPGRVEVKFQFQIFSSFSADALVGREAIVCDSLNGRESTQNRFIVMSEWGENTRLNWIQWKRVKMNIEFQPDLISLLPVARIIIIIKKQFNFVCLMKFGWGLVWCGPFSLTGKKNTRKEHAEFEMFCRQFPRDVWEFINSKLEKFTPIKCLHFVCSFVCPKQALKRHGRSEWEKKCSKVSE